MTDPAHTRRARDLVAILRPNIAYLDAIKLLAAHFDAVAEEASVRAGALERKSTV